MIPEIVVPRAAPWDGIEPVLLRRAQDGGAVRQATAVRVRFDDRALALRFDCEDSHIWATHTGRDAPLWEEEVVEVFLAPGAEDPTAYVEIEVNPLGAIFDARVFSPELRRATMTVDASWDATGLAAQVTHPRAGSFRVELTIPWTDLCDGPIPGVWRANFYRIDRPAGGEAEFSCWSPTLADPPDFHLPALFGRMVLSGRV